MADKWAQQAKTDSAPKEQKAVTVRDVFEALVLDLTRLNHPLPLTEAKLKELKD